MLNELTSDDFGRYLNQRFRIWPEGAEPLDVELDQVTILGNRSGDEDGRPRRKPFSIIFRSARSDTYLPQRMYTVEHEQMGALAIFLVPVGRDKLGMLYEAVFG